MKTVLQISVWLLALTLNSMAHAADQRNCYIQAYDNHFLTAVGGGNRITDVIHTDATVARSWETFKVIKFINGPGYAFKTASGHYLTAVGGGGRTTDVIHSDATRPSRWERFQLISLGGNVYAIQTYSGHYLTAQDSGGRITDVIHSNATRIGNWEKFRFTCSN